MSERRVVIVGGGIVGLVCANLLANLPINITVIDAKALQGDPVEPIRVSAINRASEQVLVQLAVWQDCDKSPYHSMVVWNESSDIDFHCQQYGEPNLGHIVKNHSLQHRLLQRLGQYNNVNLCIPEKVTHCQLGEHSAEVTLASGAKLAADLIIGADGALSKMRELVNMPLTTWSYEQQAIVATIQLSQSHQQTAWQRFLPDGPLALLPLADEERCSIVWSLATEQAKAKMALNDEQFCEALTRAYDGRLGKVVATSARQSFPLQMRHAKDYVKPRFALIGDAAHTIHPLAGQGMNLGIADAASLAQVIADACNKGRDFGELYLLQRFQRQRKSHNLAMVAGMEGFKRLFGAKQPWVSFLRNLGLAGVNQLPFLKQQLLHLALGKL